MEIVGIVLFWIVLLVGVFIIPFGVAGTFIIVADALIYGLITGFERFSFPFVVVLLALALTVELIEGVLGVAMTRKFGGSKWGMAGAMIGGFFGALIGTPVMPVVGSLLGGFLGAFCGAMILEYLHIHEWKNAFRCGLGAFVGAIGGKVTKIVAAMVMVILIGFHFWG